MSGANKHISEESNQSEGLHFDPAAAEEEDEALLAAMPPSSLDEPRRLIDPGTSFPILTSLFSDLKPLAAETSGVSVFYIHIPSSSIVEERLGWEALEAYRGSIANYLLGLGQQLRHERGKCILCRAFADDFVIVTPQKDLDNQLPTSLAEYMKRHLSAIDKETAEVLQIYVGTAQGKPFPKIHPERFLYRLIQQAQKEATDVGRQRIAAQVRLLDRCITASQFDMLYQPIARLSDHSIFAYEALVRCTQKELRNPHVLFNVAEQGERIWPLSRLLRRIAVDEVPQLPLNTYMFINVHPKDFDDPALLDHDNPIGRYPLKVVLEITERAAILDLDHFRNTLDALRAKGLRIAVDDFGSGYSALNLVAELHPDFIKFDMTLIRDIQASSIRQKLVRNMVHFAADLGAQTVAEGVETLPELQTVHELGCHLVQGFYLAYPSPPFIQNITVAPVSPAPR